MEQGRKLTTSSKAGPGGNCPPSHKSGGHWRGLGDGAKPNMSGALCGQLGWAKAESFFLGLVSYWNTAPLHLSCYAIVVLCGAQEPTWRTSSLYTSFSLFNRKMSLEGVGGKLQFSTDLPLLAASWMGDARSFSGWGLAPYCRSKFTHSWLPLTQALNNGVCQSTVTLFTCKEKLQDEGRQWSTLDSNISSTIFKLFLFLFSFIRALNSTATRWRQKRTNATKLLWKTEWSMGCQAPRMFLNILSPLCPPPGTWTWTLVRISWTGHKLITLF